MKGNDRRYRATRLDAEITAQGLKQRWIAEQTGIGYTLFNHIVRGRRTASAADAERIALVLRRPLFALFVSLDCDDSPHAGEVAEAVA